LFKKYLNHYTDFSYTKRVFKNEYSFYISSIESNIYLNCEPPSLNLFSFGNFPKSSLELDSPNLSKVDLDAG
jgi:hypothetical protein